MANPLVKFARGAAGAGAVLYADQYQQETRAELMAKRDAVLEKYRQAAVAETQNFQSELQKGSQEFSTQERVAEQEFRSGESALDREATAASPRTRLAEKQLKSMEDMDALRQEYNEAKTPEGKMDAVRKIMVANGKPIEGLSLTEPTANQKDVAAMVKSGLFKNDAEAWKYLKGDQGDLVVPLFKAMSEKQEYLRPGNEGYMTPDEILKEARRMAGDTSASMNTGGGKATSSQYETPEAIRAAYKKGEISRSKAAKLLEQFE